jgi:syntaxin 18
VWFLQRRLEEVSEFQMNMVQIRLDRERERSKSILYRAKGPSNIAMVNGESSLAPDGGVGNLTKSIDMGKALELEEPQQDDGAWKDLSPEQLQIFEKEQQDMLKQYSDELNKIKAAESSLLDISSLQSQLAMNLETQSAHIDQLVQDSYFTTEQVGSGNKQLKKASERPSTARMIFWATCALCTTLVVWDYFI